MDVWRVASPVAQERKKKKNRKPNVYGACEGACGLTVLVYITSRWFVAAEVARGGSTSPSDKE